MTPFIRLLPYPLDLDREAVMVMCVHKCCYSYYPVGVVPTGRRLAELEIYILLTKLIPRFTLSTDKDSIALFQAIVLRPNEPVTFTIKKRFV